MSDFQKEHRYWVFKRKHLRAASDETLKLFSTDYTYGPVKESVVVESDWPNYAHVWETVKRVAEGTWEDPYAKIAELEAQLAAARHEISSQVP